MKWVLASLTAVVIALVPGTALAQDGDRDDLLLRIGADVTIAGGDTVGNVIVIDGNVRVEGAVTNHVLVISGDAVVAGTIDGDITVISGNIELLDGSRVDNVNSVRGDVTAAPDATIAGEIRERDAWRFDWVAGILFSLLFWLSLTVAFVVAGLVFAASGGSQLTRASLLMTGDAVNAILGTVFLWVGLPLLAGLILITIIGIPLGIGILVFLMPALWFLGYIVAGTRLGLFIVGKAGREPGTRPLLAAVVGVLALQAIVLVPVLGVIVAILAGVWGAGALAFVAFEAAGGRGFRSTPSGPAAG